MKHLSLFLILLLAVAASVEVRAATVPPLINYQGTLTDAQGQPVANTAKKLTFNIYDAVADGNLIWGPQVFDSVPVISGMFNVILGTTDTEGRLITEAFDNDTRFLGITVDEVGQNGGTEIAPRQQIFSTAFAFRAEHALTADNAAHAAVADSSLKSETVEGEHLYVDPDNGKVGI
ncbi:MAG: hypothetical protein D3919_15360, partial [Candidatus Electrothrix sp. AW5]|nr:hypothetical protein [Candidatus Electrothrix gigas]